MVVSEGFLWQIFPQLKPWVDMWFRFMAWVIAIAGIISLLVFLLMVYAWIRALIEMEGSFWKVLRRYWLWIALSPLVVLAFYVWAEIPDAFDRFSESLWGLIPSESLWGFIPLVIQRTLVRAVVTLIGLVTFIGLGILMYSILGFVVDKIVRRNQGGDPKCNHIPIVVRSAAP